MLGFALYASVFALPVFLQNLLGYTAWDTGKVILPGAIASAVTMAMMGRLGSRFDARYLITSGVALFCWSMWLHYHFTLDIGMHDLFWPMILRGVGLGCIFVPLTRAGGGGPGAGADGPGHRPVQPVTPARRQLRHRRRRRRC